MCTKRGIVSAETKDVIKAEEEENGKLTYSRSQEWEDFWYLSEK